MTDTFHGNEFEIQIISSGSFTDSTDDRKLYLVEVTAIRLNRAAFDEWLNSRVLNARGTYSSDQEWHGYKNRQEELDRVWKNKITEALGLDPKKGSVHISQALSEVFTVVYMYRQPDVEAAFEFNGMRKNPVFNGYSPVHQVKDDYLSSGIHHYYDAEKIPSNGSGRGTITFLSPEAYPGCLWAGKKLTIQEGSRVVGCATIEKIFNPILFCKPEEHGKSTEGR